jgi:hypothetical protein
MIIVKGKMMQIKSVKSVGKRKVYDISVKDAEHYVLENGVVTHNTGSYYSADNIFILGRQQEKEGTEVVGYNFIINVEKSRYVKEKSKIPITVSFDGGISKWSGLLDIALESKHVVKPSNGWYSRVDVETGEIEDKKFRIKDTDTKEFWLPILEKKSFKDYVESRYSIANGNIMQEDIDDAFSVETMNGA